MRTGRYGFLLGIGSNINPHDNFIRIVQLLLKCFESFHLSRVLHIPPVGMNSQHHFLNAVAFIETTMPETTLKTICNQIEIALGRDRCDPNSKNKDRPADLDILSHLQTAEDWACSTSTITDEYFLYPLIDELKAYLNHASTAPQQLQHGVRLQADGLSFGETATTIYRDRYPG